jgi:tRNA threonylcarbamoyladenosine biosynthesis protein TsaE
MLLRAESLAATHAIAAELAGLARPGDVIVLAGDMGAGKTAFAKGFGAALGITEPITSPTFTLVHSYECGKITLHHADLYRLERTTEVVDLALAELAEFDGIVLVEWGDVANAALGDHLEVRLELDDVDLDPGLAPADEPGDDAGDDTGDDDADALLDGARIVEITPAGRAWAGRWDRLVHAMEPFRC